MGWLKKDDRFPEHRKIRRLTDGAYRLHDTALHACAKDETDGLVTEDDIADMQHGPRLHKHVSALVRAGLWHELGPGRWQINDYLDYNPSHAENEARRKQARDRQARWRKSRTEGDVSQRDEDVSDASVTRTSHHPVPTRPDPSRPVPYMESPSPGGSPKQRATGNPQPCGEVHDVAKSCGACADARHRAKVDDLEAQRAKSKRERDAHRADRERRRAEAAQAAAEAEADPDAIAQARARAKAAVTAARGGDQ